MNADRTDPGLPALQEARRRGSEVIGGVEMFVSQGAAQFRMFTGRDAPLAIMERVVLDALGSGGGRSAPIPPSPGKGRRRTPRPRRRPRRRRD